MFGYIGWTFSTFVGVIVIIKALVTVIRTIKIHILKSSINLTSHYGKWALVTGCTSGIGESLAKSFASKGFSMVLVARQKDKLDSIAKTLETQYKVPVKKILADLECRENLFKIQKEVHDLDLGVLVNNAGVFPSYGEWSLMALREQTRWALLEVNCIALSSLTRMLLPNMLQRRKQSGNPGSHRVLLINVGSLSGVRPVPFMSLYSASKAFVNRLSECLRIEMANEGVDVFTLSPVLVKSNMSLINKFIHNSVLSLPAEVISQTLVESLPHKCNNSFNDCQFAEAPNTYHNAAHWTANLTMLLLRSLPLTVLLKMISRINKFILWTPPDPLYYKVKGIQVS